MSDNGTTKPLTGASLLGSFLEGLGTGSVPRAAQKKPAPQQAPKRQRRKKKKPAVQYIILNPEDVVAHIYRGEYKYCKMLASTMVVSRLKALKYELEVMNQQELDDGGEGLKFEIAAIEQLIIQEVETYREKKKLAEELGIDIPEKGVLI